MARWLVVTVMGTLMGAFILGYGFVSRFATVDAVNRVEEQTQANTNELARRSMLVVTIPQALRDIQVELAAMNVRLARIEQRLSMRASLDSRDPR